MAHGLLSFALMILAITTDGLLASNDDSFLSVGEFSHLAMLFLYNPSIKGFMLHFSQTLGIQVNLRDECIANIR